MLQVRQLHPAYIDLLIGMIQEGALHMLPRHILSSKVTTSGSLRPFLVRFLVFACGDLSVPCRVQSEGKCVIAT
jgi:hypothetical protein